MKKLNVILFLLLLQHISSGQESSSKPEGFPVNFSYFGERIFHPGMKVSVEFPLWSKTKQKELKHRVRGIQKSFLLLPGTGFYVHPNSHTAVFVNLESCFRKTKTKSGFKFEILPGIGYQGRINAGTTYIVEDDGSITEKKVAGRSYFTTSLGFGLGQDLFVKKQIPIAWHLRPGAVVLMPYNTTTMLSFNLEAGITYRFFKKEK